VSIPIPISIEHPIGAVDHCRCAAQSPHKDCEEQSYGGYCSDDGKRETPSRISPQCRDKKQSRRDWKKEWIPQCLARLSS